jgi:hypothetical protein
MPYYLQIHSRLKKVVNYCFELMQDQREKLVARVQIRSTLVTFLQPISCVFALPSTSCTCLTNEFNVQTTPICDETRYLLSSDLVARW